MLDAHWLETLLRTPFATGLATGLATPFATQWRGSQPCWQPDEGSRFLGQFVSLGSQLVLLLYTQRSVSNIN